MITSVMICKSFKKLGEIHALVGDEEDRRRRANKFFCGMDRLEEIAVCLWA